MAFRTVTSLNDLNLLDIVKTQPEGYLEYITKNVFADECIFCLNGSVNKKNVSICRTERPAESNLPLMNWTSGLVWCTNTILIESETIWTVRDLETVLGQENQLNGLCDLRT